MAYRPHRRLGKRPLARPVRPGMPAKPASAVAPGTGSSAKSAAPPAQCVKCHGSLEPGATFCGACGAPVRVGVKPKRTGMEVRRNIQKGRNLRQIRSGANTLLLLAVLNMIGGVFVYLMFQGDCESLLKLDISLTRELLAEQGGNVAEFERGVWVARHFGVICFAEYGLPALIFLGLFAWARTSPLPATVAGLITYLTVMIAGFAFNPAALLSPVGWVIRIAILGALGSAIQSASAERRIAERESARKRAEDLARRRTSAVQGAVEAAEEQPG